MDINMPEMDGIESSRLIKQSFVNRELRSKPFITAITAHTSIEMQNSAMSVGMEKFLTKPAEATLVYELIRQVINRRESLLRRSSLIPSMIPTMIPSS